MNLPIMFKISVWCLLLDDNIVLNDESVNRTKLEFELWRKKLETKISKLRRTKANRRR